MSEKKICSYKDVDINLATKTMREYLELKQKYDDSILFYKIGDFYETFFEDAVLLSEVCGVVLTSRKYSNLGSVPLAGVPAISLEGCIKKLISKNIKVVQTEQVKKSDETIGREVVRIYTKATVFEAPYLEGDKNNYLCAILTDKDKCGLAYCDVSCGSFYLTVGEKAQIERELAKLCPDEILVKNNDILADFKNIFEDFRNFSVDEGTFLQVANDFEILENEYKLGYVCASAILNYLGKNQKNFMPKLQKPVVYSVSNFLSMDFQTRRALELTRGQADFKKRGTLFWLLNKTKTNMGARCLKSWVCSPIRDFDEIKRRQTVVEFFLNNEKNQQEAYCFLENFCDLLRLSSRISNKTIEVKELFEVATCLNKILDIKDLLVKIGEQNLNIKNCDFDCLFDFSEIIFKTISKDDTSFEKLPIKDGANPKLDYCRSELFGLQKELDKLQKEQNKILDGETKILNSGNLGYYFEAPIKFLKNISPDCVVKQQLRSVFRYSTKKLLELEQKLFAKRFQVAQIEEEIFANLKEYSSELAQKIAKFADLIAQLDAFLSLCKVVEKHKFCKVEFSSSGVFEIIEGKHPCVEEIFSNYIPNDTHLDERVILNVLTGGNMAGKSTYLKQNAICVILSFVCGFAPAKNAKIPLFDKLFFHSCCVDNLAQGSSTFMEEMKNLATIVNNSTGQTLVLLDEPIKTTCANEAIKLCCGFVKYNLSEIGAKTILATHYATVANFAQKQNGAEVFVINDYKITKGVQSKTNAIEVALASGLSPKIIEFAKEVEI